MTDTEASKAAVIRLLKAFATRDSDTIGACLTDDVVWVAPRGNATAVAIGDKAADDAGAPDGSNSFGKDRILSFIARDFGRLFVADVRNELRLLIGEGEHVMAETRLSATLVNGRTYVNDYCFLYRVRDDGLVAEIREYMDTRGGWAQMFGAGEGRALI